MINVNWNEVEEATEFNNPVPGGYAARIIDVEDVEKKEYLKIVWDYVEGEFKGYNQETYDRAGFYPCTMYRSYKEKALPFFKGFKKSVEDSNPNFKFDCANPKCLIGKYVGVVLGEEEYEKNDKTISTRLYVAYTCAGSKIRNKDFKIPEFKKLKGTASASAADNLIEKANSNGIGDLADFEELKVDDGSLPF